MRSVVLSRRHACRRALGGVAALAAAAVAVPAGTAPAAVAPAVTATRPALAPQVLVRNIDGPRGVTVGPQGRLVYTQVDGTFRQFDRNGVGAGRVIILGRVPRRYIAPAVSMNSRGTMFLLTAGTRDGSVRSGAGVLYTWRPGPGRKRLASIAEYQQRDPDPFNVERGARESNPFGVAGLAGGGALVADAAGNDLLKVTPRGRVMTVARIKPRWVRVPEGLGNTAPPAGTRVRSEAVPTSVVVGADGYWYVGELRGSPATPGESQIWRIKPGTKNAVCRPYRPNTGSCRRWADGLTSIVDLGAGGSGGIFALELSKQSWLKMELNQPGSEIGALLRITHRGAKPTEFLAGDLVKPGGVEAKRGHLYVTNPVSGTGQLTKVF